MGFEGDVPKSTYTEGIYVQIALCGYWVAMDYPGSNNYGVQDDAIMMLQICTWQLGSITQTSLGILSGTPRINIPWASICNHGDGAYHSKILLLQDARTGIPNCHIMRGLPLPPCLATQLRCRIFSKLLLKFFLGQNIRTIHSDTLQMVAHFVPALPVCLVECNVMQPWQLFRVASLLSTSKTNAFYSVKGSSPFLALPALLDFLLIDCHNRRALALRFFIPYGDFRIISILQGFFQTWKVTISMSSGS